MDDYSKQSIDDLKKQYDTEKIQIVKEKEECQRMINDFRVQVEKS